MNLNRIVIVLMVAVWGLLTVPTVAQDQTEPTYDASVPKPTLSEVKYGPHERNVMDVWKAETPEGQSDPRPVVFVIHGGAWRNGSKERIDRFVDVQKLLDEGISVVSINYRLISNDQLVWKIDQVDMTQPPPVHAPLHDAARALQFVRSMAEEWNLDKTRIGAAGGSAGACTSLWLLYHDDLADPDSDDPVARESTRLTCAAVRGAQTTLDPQQMLEWTPNSKYGNHAFGINNFKNYAEARDQLIPWIKEYSPYHLVTKDDPPVYLAYWNKPEKGKEQKDPTHSANFGEILAERCKEVGVACEFYYPGAPDVEHENTTGCLIAKLTDQ